MKDQKTNQMQTEMNQTVAISEEAQEKMYQLVEENYHAEDMIDFIQEYGNDAFVEHYEEYVQCGEDYSYDAVDAFIAIHDIDCIAHFTDAYYGEYDSEEQFAQQFTEDVYGDTPNHLVVDWSATWECNLRHDFTFQNGYVFCDNF